MRGKKRGDPSEGGWTETEGTEQDKQDKRRRDERSLNEMRVFGMITAQTEERRAPPLTSPPTSPHLYLPPPRNRTSPLQPSTSPSLFLSGVPFPSLSRYFITSSPPLCHFLSLLRPSLPPFLGKLYTPLSTQPFSLTLFIASRSLFTS